MGRVKDNSEILGKLKNNIRSKDLMECQVEMLNQIRCLLADISRSLAVIADCNNLESMSVICENETLTHNEKRALAQSVLKLMMNGDLDGAGKDNCQDGKENSDG